MNIRILNILQINVSCYFYNICYILTFRGLTSECRRLQQGFMKIIISFGGTAF